MITLIICALLGTAYGNMVCRYCEGVASIDDCANTITCGNEEECFLEKKTTTNLGVAYSAGCRSQQVCRIMELLAGNAGRKRDLVNCAQCCNSSNPDSPCNGYLCNVAPSVQQSTCLVCDALVASAASCTTKQVCQDTQICRSSIHVIGGTLLRYKFGCESYTECSAFVTNGIIIGKNGTTTAPGVLGRRDDAEGTEICTSCCRGEICNREDCFLTASTSRLTHLEGMTLQNIAPPSTPSTGR